MNGKDLLIGLGNIGHRYYDEAEYDTIVETRKYRTIRRPLLVAAVIVLTLLLVGCAVAYVNGWFTDLFAARSEIPLSDKQVEFIQGNEQVIMETQSSNDWIVELKSTMTDGDSGYILFGITSPTDIDLESYHENSKTDRNAPYITPGNYSRRGSMRALVIASTGFSDEDLNFMWCEHGHWEADNDGISNTLNFIIELRCDKLHPNKERLLKEPFGKDITFTARFFDFTLEYEDQEVRESIEAKLTTQGDSLIGGEEMQGLYKTDVLVEGEWIFDISFLETASQSLQLITEPVTVNADVHRKVESGTVYYDTKHKVEPIEIKSFVLTSMGADIMYHQDEDMIGLFLEWENHEGVFVVMNDGSQIQLRSNGTGYKWSSDVPIILQDVVYVKLPDGTEIKAP